MADQIEWMTAPPPTPNLGEVKWNTPPPPAAPKGGGSGRAPSPEMLAYYKHWWEQAGGDPNASEMMAYVGANESGGKADARNPSGATGLWQIYDHGPGNWNDPLTNAKEAVALFNARRAHGGTGLEDWEASRNEGAFGGWGPFYKPIVDALKALPKGGMRAILHATDAPTGAQPSQGRADPFQAIKDAIQSAAHQFGRGGAAEAGELPKVQWSTPGGSASPTPTVTPGPNANSMDNPGGEQGAPQEAPAVHSALGWLAGQQDIMFILRNAQLRDGGNKSVPDLLKDPHSYTSQAWSLYRKDPASAMDEYGLGSPSQNAFMAKHFGDTDEGRYSDFMNHHPKTNAAVTMIEEFFNPVAAVEGGVAGKLLHVVGETAAGARAADAAQGVASKVGFGSPLYELRQRAGVEGSQWMKGTIASVKQEDQNARKMMLHLFDGLNQDEQWEVVRLSQGSKPDPRFETKYEMLKTRADALRADIKAVTAEQKRAGILKGKTGSTIHGEVYNPEIYFPMSNTHDFGPQYELEQQLSGKPQRGGRGTTAEFHRLHPTVDAWRASGTADADASAAEAYETWRRQRMQGVTFEDRMADAPPSLRRNVQPSDFETSPLHPIHGQGLKLPPESNVVGPKGSSLHLADEAEKVLHVVDKNNAFYGPESPFHITAKDQTDYVVARNILMNQRSPIMQKSMIAPELWKFMQKDGQFAKYVDQGGSYLPGEEQGFFQRAVSIFRNAIVSNILVHPAANIAGNDAAARGLQQIGGLGKSAESTALPWEMGGYAYNSAKAIALQAGLAKPEKFIGSAQEYSAWMDQALKAGAKAVFGTAKTSVFGQPIERLLTEPITGRGPKAWIQRLDKAMTRFSAFNMERTFEDKGEAAFAVSLFKDAVTQGKMSDYQAGEMVRESLGDYYNFDPKSPWSAALLFMPWLKGNVKFWMNTLVRKPQYLTGPTHAIRDYNQQEGDPGLSGPFAPPDFRVYTQGKDEPDAVKKILPEYITPPFVGRDAPKIANAATGGLNEAGYESEALVEGRANPFARAAMDFLHTESIAGDSKSVKGPETDYKMIFNPKAPGPEQLRQVAQYMAGHFIPIPLVGYALADAMRRGMNAKDLSTAFISASGAGYGSQTLDDDQRRDQSKAQKAFLSAYWKATDEWQGGDREAGASDLQAAWDDYTQALRDAGILH